MAETAEKKTPERKSLKEWAVRVVLLIVGLCIAHLGVTLFLLTDLGSDPFNVFVQGLFRKMSGIPILTHGRVHLALSLLIMVILIIVDRSYVGIGTILCMALGGPIIDLYSIFLAPLINDGLHIAVRIALLVLGCAILAFGMTVVISSETGAGPNDLVAVVISDKLKKPFGVTRVIVDIVFAGTGFLLGGVLGIGTVICAFIVGPVAQIFFPLSRKICAGCVNKTLGK